MKKLSLLVLAICISTSAPAAFGQAKQNIPDCPKESGFYYLSESGWKAMEKIHSSGLHSTGIAKSAFSYGIASAKVKTVFPDSKAPVQLNDGQANFCSVNIAEQLRDVIIVRLEEHKDRRELKTASVRAWTGVDMQFKESDRIPTSGTKQGDTGFLFTTQKKIEYGEYMILITPTAGAYAGPGVIGGYDFGFHPQK